MSSPFPLLRLPGVVLCEVFQSLSIGEKIKLSLCSKKISTLINNDRLYSQKVIVDLDLSNQNIEVYSENDDKNDAFEINNCSYSGTISDSNMQQYRIQEGTVPVIPFAKGIITLWKNNREGFLSVIRYLLKIFRCKFSIINDSNRGSLQPIISDLLNLQVEFKKLTIYLNGLKDENLFWNQISNKFGLVEDLEIFSVDNPGFRPVFTSWPKKITIINSAWFTLEHLLACTCTAITLGWSPLGNTDMDEILRTWKAGGFPNLNYLFVYGHRITIFESTILGMNWRELSTMIIQTDDGSKKATIKLGDQDMEMSVTPFD
ncbi:hypothetical protein CRE_22044 [Caenorhabditis remanei]|uniref:F-box domain-containing protein n=1 Tax=Caenorhabditis remanei TaxID=31234 RepID=E3N3I9_CAERE|nr:hypothetical protein CRE_22044 [Caenorhabditis remanei]